MPHTPHGKAIPSQVTLESLDFQLSHVQMTDKQADKHGQA